MGIPSPDDPYMEVAQLGRTYSSRIHRTRRSTGLLDLLRDLLEGVRFFFVYSRFRSCSCTSFIQHVVVPSITMKKKDGITTGGGMELEATVRYAYRTFTC